MIVDVKAPEAGESIVEGFIVEWFKQDGASVEEEEALFEFETDKITMEVPSPAAGTLSIKAQADSTVKIGEIVATIDTGGASKSAAPAAAQNDDAPKAAEPETDAPHIDAPAGKPQAEKKLAEGVDLNELSPAVRRMVAENAIDPKGISGSGKDGRLTKEDVQRHLDGGGQTAAPKAASEPAKPADAPKPAPQAVPQAEPGERQSRKRMSALRQRIAQRLVESQQTTATLTTFNEVDMSTIMAVRNRYKDAFEKKYGVRLGFMSFFVKAAVDALQAIPQINAQIDGDQIVQNNFYDIGVAIGSDKGLVVPIVRDADKLNYAEIELAISDFAKKVKSNKLDLKDLQGGSFTISNGGVYGSLNSTPILNPPQSAILGMHATKKRAVVVNDEIVIRPMMYLALSYDHRIVDGKDAVTFLKRIVEVIENPERILLGV